MRALVTSSAPISRFRRANTASRSASSFSGWPLWPRTHYTVAMTSVLARTDPHRRGTTVRVVEIIRLPYSEPICMTAREAMRNWAMAMPGSGPVVPRAKMSTHRAASRLFSACRSPYNQTHDHLSQDPY